MDNETLDKVFNLVFGRYKQIILLQDNYSMPVALTHIVELLVVAEPEECVIGAWTNLWIGPKPTSYQLCLTQLRLRVADSTLHQWQNSCVFTRYSGVFRGYCIDKLDYSASAIEMRRAVADTVVGLFTAWHCKSTGLRLVEDCDNSRAVLDVSSLEELLVKADLTA